jgi:predicted AAA+ superfamily ATPase
MHYKGRFYPLTFPRGQSIILLGPRKTGKTTFLKHQFKESLYIDLLRSELLRKYSLKPERLREELLMIRGEKKNHPIIIDEIQLIPTLLNEIHWLIENTTLSFILCGSSARKLRAAGVNLLGGRAWTYRFFPFTHTEIKPYALDKLLACGTVPTHYLSSSYHQYLSAYVENYLTLEIQQEGLVRNLPAFQHFLSCAAFSSGEIVNYANIGREAGIGEKTVKAYFDILEDTLIGYRLFPFTKKNKRDLIFKSQKFYFFDVGLTSFLKEEWDEAAAAANKGHLLESYIFQELNAYCTLRERKIPLKFWRTTNGLEVDFILGKSAAIEVKHTNNVHTSHLKGLAAFGEEHAPQHLILVCNEPHPRLVHYKGFDIQILDVNTFLDRLWGETFYHF